VTAPGRIPGTDDRPERRALGEALRLLHTARRGPPTEADVPPPSVFPLTKAARAALDMARAADTDRQSRARRRPGEGS
jgi:hypothetical protein